MKKIIPILLWCCLLSSCAVQRQTEPRRYQTLTQKANATLQFDQREYSMSCSIQMWRNELIILSLQPILGVEMFRLEASQDSILVIDKMNRRYTTLAYDWASKAVQPTPSYKMIQDFVTPPLLSNVKASSQRTFEIGGHKIGIKCAFWQREYNTLAAPKRQDLKKYKRVSLREILPL
jgi:hypothetical protein